MSELNDYARRLLKRFIATRLKARRIENGVPRQMTSAKASRLAANTDDPRKEKAK